MNKVISPDTIKYIKSWLELRYDNADIPGYSVAICHNGKVILNEAFGFANLKSKQKLTSDNIFRVASISKTFTATVIMQLVEEGRLRLDDKMSDHLDWLKGGNDKRLAQITVRQVMSHGAGIIRDGLDSGFWNLDRPFPDRDEIKKTILESGLVIENNVRMKYSNWGYGLLGLLIEKVVGKPYNDVVTERIIKPLDLKNTFPEYRSDMRDKMSVGYTRREFGLPSMAVGEIYTDALSPATGFCSNAADLCRFFSAHTIGSGELLNDESKKEMQKGEWSIMGDDSNSLYGLGMDIRYIRNKKIVGHGGSCTGHKATGIFDSENKLAIVVLANFFWATPFNITRGIYNAIDNLESPKMDKEKYDKLSKFQGRFANLWGPTDIIFCGNKLIKIWPDCWNPFGGACDLKYIDENTLQIDTNNSYGNIDEKMKFEFKDGKVKAIYRSGELIMPIDEWKKKRKSMSIVALSK